jgi:hypothetical protein
MVCRSLVDAFLNSSPGMFPWTEPGFDGRSDQFPIKSSPEGSAFLTSLSNSLFNRTTDQGCIVHVVLSQVRKCAGLWISRQPVQTIPTDHGMRGWVGDPGTRKRSPVGEFRSRSWGMEDPHPAFGFSDYGKEGRSRQAAAGC